MGWEGVVKGLPQIVNFRDVFLLLVPAPFSASYICKVKK